MAERTVIVAVLGVAGLALGASGQTVVAGPTVNPSNGHRYTLLQATSWEQARGWARDRGSDLATIEDLAENAWLYTTFGANGTRKYLIGLSDTAVPGTLSWSDGSGSGYRRWAAGEPAHGTPGHQYAIVQTDQMWYIRGTNYAPYYMVESSGPLRVPQEYPTVLAAFQSMGSLGTYDIDIAPGIYTVPMAVSATIPTARTAHLRGAGSSGTTIVVTDDYNGFGLTGNWSLEGIQFIRGASGTVLSLYGGTTRLRDVTIDGGGVSSRYPGIDLGGNAQLVARGSTFKNLYTAFSSEFGGGHLSADSCLFHTITSVTSGAMSAELRGCTVRSVGWTGATVFATPVSLTNCIVWDRSGPLASSSITARFSDLQGAGGLGEGVIDADPLFTSSVDHRLRPGSPCINAGSAEEALGGSDLAGNPRVSGTAPDLGAFELQVPSCPVDFNGDGFVDFFDYDDFVAAFEGGC